MTTDHLEYRHATHNDAYLLSVLLRTVYIETYGTEGISLEFAHFIETNFSQNKIASEINDPKICIWVAAYKSNPVGLLKVVQNSRNPLDNQNYPEVNKLYILRNFYGRGIGTQLMYKAHEELISLGEKSVWLWVLETNSRAIRLYEHLGYKTIGKAPFVMEENTYTNAVMKKDLKTF